MSRFESVVSFRAQNRKPLSISADDLVTYEAIVGGCAIPLGIRPKFSQVDLAGWARLNSGTIRTKLNENGALLFRGFSNPGIEQFETLIRLCCGEPLKYTERSSPRSEIKGNIYTSTDYPSAHSIFLHNEQSYNRSFPLRIAFCCMIAAQAGGQTPIADSRKILRHISEATRNKLAHHGYLLVRNYGGGGGVSWQEAFQTDSRSQVEQQCKAGSIEFEWLDHGRLRTRQVRPALARHPETGELTWFNHATFFNVNTLESEVREQMVANFDERDLPTNTYYGDGTPFEDHVVNELQQAYLREKVIFTWQQGDILLLDNMLVSHGREPYSGKRQVAACMAEPHSWDEVRTNGPLEIV